MARLADDGRMIHWVTGQLRISAGFLFGHNLVSTSTTSYRDISYPIQMLAPRRVQNATIHSDILAELMF